VYIKILKLVQFRNYSTLEASFSPKINCIVGPNGAGKTNILDALHFLAFTKGFRSSQDKQAVKEGDDFFLIQGDIDGDKKPWSLQCNFVKNKGKKILINRAPLKKASEHIGKVPLIAILPNDTELILGASATRRKFLDMLIAQYSPLYLDHLIQYEKILSHRNALLRQFGEHQFFDPDQLEIWDMQLIPHGRYIFEERQNFLAAFLPIFTAYFHQIVVQHETPEIKYRSQFDTNTDAEWREVLATRLQKDRVNQYSTGGIHRDDLVFTINRQVVKNFGSQGQQKTFVIALKLAQYKLLENRRASHPILLLDDIFDKLDEYRLKRIATLLDTDIEGQVFITDTSYDRLTDVFQSSEREVQFFYVKEDTLSKWINEQS